MAVIKSGRSGRKNLIGAAVGSGMAAQAAERADADFLMALSAGYYRLHGCRSMAALLPYADSNKLIWELTTRHIMPRIYKTPVLIGLCAQDPQVHFESLLKKVKQNRIAGVTNFPSVGFFDGQYREALEEAGLGFEREIEMLKNAKDLGLMSAGFCFNTAEAVEMALADVDIVCFDLGFAEWKTVDPDQHQESLDLAVRKINSAIAEIENTGKSPEVVIFGGQVTLPQDLAFVYQKTKASGYVGGSTIEQFPTSEIITQTVRSFKNIRRADYHENRLGSMIGASGQMQEVFEKIRRAAQSDAPVLIVGESGTGKELAAREIYRHSQRSLQPFTSWNCGAITESLAMAELFGHEKGAFTGAGQRRIGKFEIAHGATLFMDEIADLPLSVQAALLRALQEKEIVRLGSETPLPVDVRLIAASNQDFSTLVPEKKFRLDLYYRISTVTLKIPPLRERKEDIPLLIEAFLDEFGQKYNCIKPAISPQVMDALIEYRWPGNIRELRIAIERAFILGKGEPIQLSLLNDLFEVSRSIQDNSNLQKPDFEQENKRQKLQKVLAEVKGNKAAAARKLGVTRKTIYNWMQADGRG